MKNVWAGIGIAAVVILAVGAYWLFSVPGVSAAVLYVENGTVAVDTGHGWVAGTDEMELPVGAKVRTNPDSTASVILLEGEVVHLEPSTEISIDKVTSDTIHVTQDYGETWNKVTKISGISTFEVETPTTVATVRGTEFFVTANADEDDVAVSEGTVDVALTNASEAKEEIGPMSKMSFKKKNKQIIKSAFDDQAKINKFQAKYVKHLQHMRAQELRKQSRVVGMAKRMTGTTDAQIKQHLEELDDGAKDLDAEYKQVPGMLKAKAERTYKLTQAIRKAKMKKP